MSDNPNLWERYKNNLGSTRPWDILNPETERVSDEEYDHRFSICHNCPELVKLTKQCKKCGCFMAIKAKIKQAECPLGKW